MFESQANKQTQTNTNNARNTNEETDVASIEINTKHENKPVNQQTNKQMTNTNIP